MLPAYAELHCRSNFSFLTAASHPEELVARAAELGYAALAITDECSLAGVVRARRRPNAASCTSSSAPKMQLTLPAAAARAPRHPMARPHAAGAAGPVAAQLRQPGGWITVARRAAKGSTWRTRPTWRAACPARPRSPGLPGCFALLVPQNGRGSDRVRARVWLKTWFGAERCAIAVELLHRAGDELLARRRARGRRGAWPSPPPAACSRALRKPAATRSPPRTSGCRWRSAASASKPNAGRTCARARRIDPIRRVLHARSPSPGAAASRSTGAALQYPREIVPDGHTPASWLRAGRGGRAALPRRRADAVRALVEHELALIAQLKYEALLPHRRRHRRLGARPGHPVPGPRQRGQLGGCYCLGITEVDPARMNMLFERFISAERNEPPDIDVDFEHQRARR